MRNKRIQLFFLVVVLSVLLGACNVQTNTEDEYIVDISEVSLSNTYPNRPINLIIPFDAGGDTDLWNRKLINLIAEEMQWSVSISNLTGGVSGAAGTSYVWNQPHNGYFIAGTSETPLLIPVMNEQSGQLTDEWEYWIAGGSVGLLCVNKQTPYKNLQQLVKVVREGEEVKIASTSGGLWFLLSNLCSRYSGVNFESATYAGSASAIEACIAGETVAVAASAGEMAEDIIQGELIPIAVFDTQPYELEGYGEVRAIVDVLPALESYMGMKQFLGFMVPSDTPQEIIKEIDTAFKTVMNQPEIQQFATKQYAKIYNLSGKEARKMCKDAQATMSWVLEEMEMTQISPENVGIERP